jgi:hypothetical protein
VQAVCLAVDQLMRRHYELLTNGKAAVVANVQDVDYDAS